MKKYLLTSILFFAVAIAFAQIKPKQKGKEKPPTQKEMKDMMKEAQDMMDEMSPEDKKMMDSMGIKMPDMKSIQKSGVTDAQLQKAFEDDSRIVPVKDVARIKVALAITLSNSEMSAYFNKTHEAVLNILSPGAKLKGEEILQQILNLKSSVANSAVGLWMDGNPALALYLMGAACKADPSNTNDLNNYASFLTMCGAEQMALPILSNLNKNYPQNSTILNNIAQAWLGLGDILRAEKYADSVIRIYAAHPQANMAKCLIEESKGNIPAAVAAAKKSISKAYSNEKENKLKQLGYDLKSEDIDWDQPMPQDAMGLGRFTWPEAPLNVEQNKALELEWKIFKLDCEEQLAKLKAKQQRAEQEYEKQYALRYQQVMEASKNGQYAQLIPGYAAKAMKKLGPGVNDILGNASFVFAKELEPVIRALANVDEYEKLLSEKQELLDKKYEDQIGEGRANPLEAICKDENAIRSDFLKSANGGLQNAYKGYLAYAARRTSDLLYYYQYTMWPEQFDLMKINAQGAWLTMIKDQRVFFKEKSSWCNAITKEKEEKNSLQQFDDVHCDYVSTMNLGVYKITSSCSNLTGEFDFGGLKMNISENVETNKMNGTIQIGKPETPWESELGLGVDGFIEFDNTGITDVGIIAKGEIKVVGQTAAGMEYRFTVNSGFSQEGKGILAGTK